ncbi:hypothetical protein ACFL1X_14865, partial [Candidatus Hydrogenedentota bacterium]
VPWELEVGGRYSLRYGIDANDDEEMDGLVEKREFVFAQTGSPIYFQAEPRKCYLIEVDQIERGGARTQDAAVAPDPGISSGDIRYDEQRSYIVARVHNVGSKAVRDVQVAFYDGDPDDSGKHIGDKFIPNIEPPNDLEPRTVTVGIKWDLPEEGAKVFVVLDPEDKVKDEITTFNNKASKMLRRDPNFVRRFLGEA